MKFFETLSPEVREEAYRLLADELLDGFINANNADDGFYLPNMVEERLIEAFDYEVSETLMKEAVDFYDRLEDAK